MKKIRQAIQMRPKNKMKYETASERKKGASAETKHTIFKGAVKPVIIIAAAIMVMVAALPLVSTDTTGQGPGTDALWKDNFGGVYGNYFMGVTATSDGGFVAAGYSYADSFGNGDWSGVTGYGNDDATIVKYDSNGVVQWRKNYGGPQADSFQEVTETNDGGFVAVGYYARSDAIIVKYDSDGNLLWDKSFGGSGTDSFVGVTETFDNGLVAVGNSNTFGNGDWSGYTGNGGQDGIIVKYDSGGDLQWKKSFGGSNFDYLLKVTETSDGDIVAVGASVVIGGDWLGVTGKGGLDATVVRFDSSGNLLWNKNFGGPGANDFENVTATSDGGVVAVGRSTTFGGGDWPDIIGNGYEEAIIVKYDSGGNMLWKKTFGGPENDIFYDVMETSDGDIIAVGYSEAFDNDLWSGVPGNGAEDAIVVKYDGSGNLLWKKNFGGSSSDVFQSVTGTQDGGFVAVGYSEVLNDGDWSGFDGKGYIDAIIVKFRERDPATISASNKTAEWNNASQAIGIPTVTDDTTGLPLGVTSSDFVITYTGTGATTYGPSTTPPTEAGTYSVEIALELLGYWAPDVTVTLTIAPIEWIAIDLADGDGSLTGATAADWSDYYTYSAGVLTIKQDAPAGSKGYRIYQTDDPLANSIWINGGVNTAVMIDGIDISGRITLGNSSEVTLLLKDDNVIDGVIHTLADAVLTIDSAAAPNTGSTNGSLTVTPRSVTDDFYAGIGGGEGTIIINGGTLDVTGGAYGAGIGGAGGAEGGYIFINGGTVTAEGGAYGAGIGGGDAGDGGYIEINGGTLNITGGTGGGAGIGGGKDGEGGAGIGGGGNIIINNGIVTTTGTDGGAGIGGGAGGGSGKLEIDGGIVNTYGGTGGAGIGGGAGGAGDAITISGSEYTIVNAFGGTGGAGIGGGAGGDGGNITINHGVVTATGGYDAAGIGTGAGLSLSNSVLVTSIPAEIYAYSTGSLPAIRVVMFYSTGFIVSAISETELDGTLLVYEDGDRSTELTGIDIPPACKGFAFQRPMAPWAQTYNVYLLDEDGLRSVVRRVDGGAEIYSVNYMSGYVMYDSSSTNALWVNTGSVYYLGVVEKHVDINGDPISKTDGFSFVDLGSDYSREIPKLQGWIVRGYHIGDTFDPNTYEEGTSVTILNLSVSPTTVYFVYERSPYWMEIDLDDADGSLTTTDWLQYYEYDPATYTLYIYSDAPDWSGYAYRIYQSSGAHSVANIVIDADVTTSVTIDGIAISGSIMLEDGADLSLYLSGSSTVDGGIHAPAGTTLTIDSASSTASQPNSTRGSLVITALDASFAGIGGGDHENGGTITINGGTLDVTGGNGAAGIGGGEYAFSGTITINGGIVDAQGGFGGAGIGKGVNDVSSMGGSVTINGGTINAYGGDYAAGIGGSMSGVGGTIVIGGDAIINAYGGLSGAGIGGGDAGHGGSITINGDALVNAYGGEFASGIGGGNMASAGILITIGGDALVNAYGGDLAAGIGGGYMGNGGDIAIIEGAYVKAVGGAGGAGIGGGAGSYTGASLTIDSTAAVIAYSDGELPAMHADDDNNGSGFYVNAYFEEAISSSDEVLLIYADGDTTNLLGTLTLPTDYMAFAFQIRGASQSEDYNIYLVTASEPRPVVRSEDNQPEIYSVNALDGYDGDGGEDTGDFAGSLPVMLFSFTVIEKYVNENGVQLKSDDTLYFWPADSYGVTAPSITGFAYLGYVAETSGSPDLRSYSPSATPTIPVSSDMFVFFVYETLPIDLSETTTNGVGYTVSGVTTGVSEYGTLYSTGNGVITSPNGVLTFGSGADNMIYHIEQSGDVSSSFSGHDPDEPKHGTSIFKEIIVREGVKVTLIIEDIDLIGRITLESEAEVTLQIAGNNFVHSGIVVPNGMMGPASITIDSATNSGSSNGTLTAYGNGGAGIGGGNSGGPGGNQSAGNITIDGGTVNAIGDNRGAGIGGGGDGNGGNITITGGTVNATGGNRGAGIGGGDRNGGGTTTITGGTVVAKGGVGAAGIGGGGALGGNGGNGGNITITNDAVVIAIGGADAGGGSGSSGIGAGSGGAGLSGSPANIVIGNTATVMAYSFGFLPAIHGTGNTGDGFYVNADFGTPISSADIDIYVFSSGYSGNDLGDCTVKLTLPGDYVSFAYTTGSTSTQNDHLYAYLSSSDIRVIELVSGGIREIPSQKGSTANSVQLRAAPTPGTVTASDINKDSADLVSTGQSLSTYTYVSGSGAFLYSESLDIDGRPDTPSSVPWSSFANPVTGTANGLTPNTKYYVISMFEVEDLDVIWFGIPASDLVESAVFELVTLPNITSGTAIETATSGNYLITAGLTGGDETITSVKIYWDTSPIDPEDPPSWAGLSGSSKTLLSTEYDHTGFTNYLIEGLSATTYYFLVVVENGSGMDAYLIDPGYAIDIIVTGTGSVTVNDGTTTYGPFTADDKIFVPFTATSVTFTAVSAGTYWFEKLIITPKGGTPSAYYGEVLTVPISSDMEVEARFFTGAHFTITEGNNIGDGKVQWSADNIIYFDIPAAGKVFPVPTSVYLKAVPDSGWEFSYWIGIGAGETNPYTYAASTDLTIAAAFYDDGGTAGTDFFTITEGTNVGDGKVQWSIDDADYYDIPTGGKVFPVPTSVYLKAVPDTDWEFSYWIGIGAGEDNPYTHAASTDLTIAAVFYDSTGTAGTDFFTITEGTNIGDGKVQWSIDGTAYYDIPTGGKTFPASTTVYLEAVPDTDWEFSYWTGIGAGESNPYTHSLSTDLTIAAAFYDGTGTAGTDFFTITEGTNVGDGKVQWSIGGTAYYDIPTGGKTFPAPTSVYLKAVPDTGWEFSYWIGIGAGESNPYTYAASVDLTIAAAFYDSTGTAGTDFFTITEGTNIGDGKVQWSIDGTAYYDIPTGGKVFPVPTSVYLKAVPDTGWEFSYWIGIGAGEDNPHTHMASADLTIAAAFYDSTGTTGVEFFTITEGTHIGDGNIQWSINNVEYYRIPVGGKTFPVPTSVYLKAVPDPGWAFSYWIGIPAGETNPYAYTASTDLTIAAAFYDSTGTSGTDFFTITEGMNIGNGKVQWSIDDVDYYDIPSGGKTFPVPTDVYLKAVPGTDWAFFYWIGVVEASDTYTHVLSVDLTIAAAFYDTNSTDFTITEGTNIGNGKIQWSTDGITYYDIPTGGKTFPVPSSIYLKAVPDTDWEFSYWIGIGAGGANPYTYTASTDLTIAAAFYDSTGTTGVDFFTITEGTNIGDGKVRWSIDGTAYYDIPSGGKTFPVPTTVYLEAVPNPGWAFSYWIGIGAGESNPYTYSVSADLTVAAAFYDSTGTTGVDFFTITEGANIGDGKVQWSINDVDYYDIPAGGKTFPVPTTVYLEAVPDLGWEFSYWIGIGAGESNPYAYAASADLTIAAAFYDDTGTTGVDFFTITEGTNTGNGKVRWSIDGTAYYDIPAGGKTFPVPTSVYLKAVPDVDWEFSYWIGIGAGEANPYTHTASADLTVAAAFYDSTGTSGTDFFTITEGTNIGDGKVQWSINDVDYYDIPAGGKTFPVPTTVYLEAVPDQGWAFSYWIGIGAGEANPYTHTASADLTIVAAFYDSTGTSGTDFFTVTEGTHIGNGNVQWSINNVDYYDIPAGGKTFPVPTSVYLKAVPDTDWEFSYWIGIGAGEMNPYTYAASTDLTIAAAFYDSTGTSGTDFFTVTEGTNIGNGKVQWSINNVDYYDIPAGGKTFPAPTTIYLKAVPDTDWEFSYWIGIPAGEVNPYTYAASTDLTIAAAFYDSTGTTGVDFFTITEGTNIGDGKVQWSIDDVDYYDIPAGGKTFPAPTTIYLKAVPDTGWAFSYWIGIGAGEANPYTYAASTDLTIAAAFYDSTGTTGVEFFTITEGTNIGNGTVQWSINDVDYYGIPAGGKTFPVPTSVYLKAVPDTGWAFSYWIGIGAGEANPHTHTASADLTIAAAFYDSTGTTGVEFFTITEGTHIGNGKIQWSVDNTYYYDIPAGGKTFPVPTTVYLKAVPDTDWEFSYWIGIGAGESNPYAYATPADLTIAAAFYDSTGTTGVDFFTVAEGMNIGSGKVRWSIDGTAYYDIPAGGKTFPVPTSVYLKAVPGSGWTFSYWIGVVEASDTYTHSASSDLTVAAAFVSSAGYYNVFVTIIGSGDVEIYDGTTTHVVTGPGSTIVYVPNTVSEITITAVNGTDMFEYSDIDSGNVIYVSSVKWPISADMTVHSNFLNGALFNYYVVDVTVIGNGIVEVDDGTNVHAVNVPSAVVNIPQSVLSISIEAFRGTGYEFEKYVIDSADSILNPTNTPIAGDMSVTAVFTYAPPVPPSTKSYNIKATSDAGSTISPSGTVAVTGGTSQTFHFAVAAGYHISEVIVDGIGLSQAEIDLGYYTFRNVNMNHSIEVRSAEGGITLEIRITGSGHAEYSVNGEPFAVYDRPVFLSEFSDLTLTAHPGEGYKLVGWNTGLRELPDSTTSFDNVTESMVVYLIFEKEGSGGSAGGGLFGGADSALWWVVAAAILLLAAGALFWFLFFWRRAYDVIKVQSSASIIGKDKARRKKPYEFTVEGSGQAAYRVGEDGVWKPVPSGPGGEYVIPKNDVTDTLTIEVR